MCDALGIINFEDACVDITGLMDYRPASAISFLGRYRLIDFMLSNMTNSGISQIEVFIKDKPRSLIEHLGNGRQYNINSKRGRLSILYGENRIMSEVYNHDIANFMDNIQYIEEVNKPYVIIAPSYMIYQIDFNEVLKYHAEKNSDVTVIYKSTDNAKEEFIGCDTLSMDKDKRIVAFEKNRGKYKTRNVSLEAYVMTKKLFLELVRKAANTSSLYWFKDILADSCDDLRINGYVFKGTVYCINSLRSYFKANIELRTHAKARELFKEDWPIHTRTNDSAPSQYMPEAKIRGCSIANGCHIEGNVENCVIGRNVIIKRGAVVKNSGILPGAYIGEGAKLDHVIVDKAAIVNHVKKLVGTDDSPIYVKRRDRI